MREISLELGQQQCEALKKLYPDLTLEQAAQKLIEKGVHKRLELFIKKGRVVDFKQPNKG